ncbi:class I adenylate-forming enzyme family protein [Streptomyces sp. NPDC003077]|uniref:class I adenylate-forming enzyme family protein n=1 Tax=Streptomyces sp. NPDC003077 TaxID=3154443 RepID=UPI00339FED57
MPRDKGFYIGLMFDRAAAAHGSAPVVLDVPLQVAPDGGTRWTVAGLAGLVRELAGRLRAAGVRRGERVAVYKTNNFDIALLAAAAQRIGAVPALLSPTLDGVTATRLLERLERPWLLIDADHLTTSGVDPSAARRVLLTAGVPGPGHEGPDVEALRDHAPVPLNGVKVVGPHEPAFISHTSGTTGLPKLVVQTPSALWQRLRLQKVVASRTWKRESVALCVSFVHARFYSALNLGISYGNPLLVAVDADPAVIGPLFARHRPGVVETQPNTFVDWEVLARADGRPLANVRYYNATFDALHPRTVQTLLGASVRRSPKFFQLYGQSETGPVAGGWVSARGAADGGRSVGWPLPGIVRMRIVDDRGRPVKAGTVGHIEVRSRTRAVTYLGEDERFRRQLRDGWWDMGDLGFKDALGRLHLLDREVDRIDAVDSNLEVEDTLMDRLPELREIVVVPSESGRPLPVVCTRDDAPLDPQRWRAAIAGLPAMEDVRQIPFDQVPRTATWKVRRPELVRMLAGGGVHG